MELDDAVVRNALRPATGDWRSSNDLKDAAVLLPLLRRDGADHLLFTLRRADLPDHPGQVAFPGGSRDAGEDVVTCALRETEEEVGLPADLLTPLGRLPERVSIAGFLVAPVVARLTREHPPVPDLREVEDVFDVPLSALLDKSLWRFESLSTPRGNFNHIPYFDGGRHTVWGLTAVIARDFLRSVLEFDPGP